MADPIILNPLYNILFTPLIYRIIGVYLGGFILIFILNGFHFKNIWSRNIGQRFLSWLAIGPLYIFAVLLGGYAALIALWVIMWLAIKEVKTISSLSAPMHTGLIVCGTVSIIIASFFPDAFYSLPLMYFFILTSIGLKQNDPQKSYIETATAMYVSIWIIFSLSHFVLLGHFNNVLDTSKSLLLLIGFAVPLSDIFAYIIGRQFQKIEWIDQYKIAGRISSKKTYAGVLGNIIGAGLGVWIMYFAIDTYVPLIVWVGISILIGIAGVVGDLTESMFKRFYAVKDSGSLLPGHGGILDRIDSTLRVIVILYYTLIWFV